MHANLKIVDGGREGQVSRSLLAEVSQGSATSTCLVLRGPQGPARERAATTVGPVEHQDPPSPRPLQRSASPPQVPHLHRPHAPARRPRKQPHPHPRPPPESASGPDPRASPQAARSRASPGRDHPASAAAPPHPCQTRTHPTRAQNAPSPRAASCPPPHTSTPTAAWRAPRGSTTARCAAPRRPALRGRAARAALRARRRWTEIPRTRRGGLSALPRGKGVLLMYIGIQVGLIGGEGDAQTVAPVTWGMSYAHCRSAGRVCDEGHPEMCTTRYAGPM